MFMYANQLEKVKVKKLKKQYKMFKLININNEGLFEVYQKIKMVCLTESSFVHFSYYIKYSIIFVITN